MERKTFAFKLVDKRPNDPGKWQARDGIALASCSEITWPGNYRRWDGQRDSGSYC